MSNRTGWRFPFTADALAEAAEAQGRYHRLRETDYRTQADEFEEQIKSAGVSVHEVDVTGGKQFRVSMDDALMRSYQAAVAGAESHREDGEKFERWARALDMTPPETVFELDVDDVHYFAL